MRNFVNDAVFSRAVGQNDFFADLKAWWDSLEPMYQYAIIGSVGLSVVLLVVAIAKPSKAVGEMAEIRELLKMRMIKELAV